MSHWKIAAAQYEPLKSSLRAQVAHHLRFIKAAARHRCELLVFPSLSLTGCDDKSLTLPAPPDPELLQPLCYAANSLQMTIIAGLPVEYHDRFVRGIAVFAPGMCAPRLFHHSHGACLSRQQRTISVVDEQPQGIDLDPTFSLFTTGQCIGEPEVQDSARRLQFFSYKYSIAVLMANARGNSALWDEKGRLIVRADRGSLLLTGQRTSQGWQGDIIPLR